MSIHLRRKASLWGAFFILGQLLFLIAAGAEGVGETVDVRRVVDGDSLQLADGRKVRLVGINAPELGWGERPDQPLARDAQIALEQLIGNKPINLTYGPDRFDHYGRTLAYAYTQDRKSVGEHLLRQGLAVMVAIPPNLAHIDVYRNAERQAKQERLGIWRENYFQPIPASSLKKTDTGFRLITGQIRRVGQSRKYVYLDLSPDVAIAIGRNNWHYFGGDPGRLHGKRVLVRGWISLWRDKLRIRIGHPAMVEFSNE